MKSAPRCLPPLVLVLAAILGCDGGGRSSGGARPAGASNAQTTARYRNELFTFAIDNLNRVEECGTGDEMWEEILRRLEKLQDPASWDPKTDSLAMSWPQPDMLRQVVDRLNQWLPTQAPPADWQLDPLVAQLPPSLRKLPPLEDAAAWEFSSYDGFMLEEAVWLSNLSAWARGKTLDDLDRARKLFDWTVRNIQLDPDEVDRTRLLPREVLLLGHGTALERAWVFILLARQQGLDAAIVALDLGAQRRKTPARPEGKNAPAAPVPLVDLDPWCVTVLVDGKLYLFDPKLGLPIPAPGPMGVDRAGQLDIRPATLAQVVADDRLLRRLDLDPKQPFPITAADLKHLVLLVEGSPQYLAKRMQFLESRLSGKQRLVLTARPAAQARRFAQAAGGRATAQLWVFPYDSLQRRLKLGPQGIAPQLLALLPFFPYPTAPLYRGRVLHLKGRFAGEPGATACYLDARPANEDLQEGFQAMEAVIGKGPKDQQADRLAKLQLQAAACVQGKHDASYWLGLLAFEQGNYPSAINYFTRLTLGTARNSPWSAGAAYNTARAYEASGQPQKALQWYRRRQAISPSTYGNLLRAAWLEQANKG
jgi:tetratricopeptide (TPR) repeat protein